MLPEVAVLNELVDYLKITEDKSSYNRVHASDARLIEATRTEPRRRARSPRLNTSAMPSVEIKARVSTPLQCQDTELNARITAPVQYSETELEVHVSDVKLDTEFEARISIPPWHPNAKLKNNIQCYLNG